MIKKIQGTYPKLRIPAKSKIKTADSFFQNVKKGDEVKLYVTIEPAFEEEGEKLDTKINFEKSYKFTNNQWIDTSWSHPIDKPFPFPDELKKCLMCKSDIDSTAKKCKHCRSEIS